MRTRVKICGISRPADAENVAMSGADAMGMIFYEKSPRNVTFSQAQSIRSLIAPFVTSVAVVVNAESAFITRLETDLAIDCIQYHGDETSQQCNQAQRPYYKALRVRDQAQILDQIQQYPDARAVLLDTYEKGKPGGTGTRFDWNLIDYEKIEKPIILAGGLNPDNVYDAILHVKPYAVDVNGGVEIKPGIKDAVKINEFIIAVQEADQVLNRMRNNS